MCFTDVRPLFNGNIYLEISSERLRLLLSLPYTCSDKREVGKSNPKNCSLIIKKIVDREKPMSGKLLRVNSHFLGHRW